MKVQYLFCPFLILILSGCAWSSRNLVSNSINVSINSISDGNTQLGNKCLILPSSEETSSDDLQFKEYASYLAKALVFKGYKVTNKKSKADLIVFLDYGIGDPVEYTQTYSEPVYGQTGVASSTTTSDGFGNFYTTYQPSYGVVGTETQSHTEGIFTRYISVQAYKVINRNKKIKSSGDPGLDALANVENENDPSVKKPKQIWKTTIVSAGPSGDLRYVFPIMLGASMEYLGENTGQEINKTTSVDDQDVLYIENEKE